MLSLQFLTHSIAVGIKTKINKGLADTAKEGPEGEQFFSLQKEIWRHIFDHLAIQIAEEAPNGVFLFGNPKAYACTSLIAHHAAVFVAAVTAGADNRSNEVIGRNQSGIVSDLRYDFRTFLPRSRA